MRRLLVCVLVTLALLPAAPAGGRDRPTCRLGGEVATLAENSHARVTSKFSGGSREVRACLVGSPRVYELGNADGDYVSFDEIRLAGPFLSYREVHGDSQGRADSAGIVVDLRSNRRIVENGAVGGPVVSRGGASASIALGRVERADGRGPAVVDEAADLDYASLALAAGGDRFYWMRSGEPRTADLRRGPTPRAPRPRRHRRAKAATCRLRGRVQTVAANPFGRVVRRRTGSGWSYRSCDDAGRRRRALGWTDESEQVADVTLGGRYAAYRHTVFSHSTDPGDTTAHVVDLRTGAQVRMVPSAAGPPLVTPSGTLLVVTSIGERPMLVVERHDASGRSVVDAGPGVVPASLALNDRGDRLYWLATGGPRTALV